MNKNTEGSKQARQRCIRELVRRERVPNQEALRRRLARRGLRATQATLSRDLKELSLVKTAEGYALPGDLRAGEAPLPPLSHLTKDFVLDLREAQNLLVVKTGPGSAQPVAAALDSQQWSEVVGTVAGDDTVLVIAASRRNCHALANRLRGLMG